MLRLGQYRHESVLQATTGSILCRHRRKPRGEAFSLGRFRCLLQQLKRELQMGRLRLGRHSQFPERDRHPLPMRLTNLPTTLQPLGCQQHGTKQTLCQTPRPLRWLQVGVLHACELAQQALLLQRALQLHLAEVNVNPWFRHPLARGQCLPRQRQFCLEEFRFDQKQSLTMQ